MKASVIFGIIAVLVVPVFFIHINSASAAVCNGNVYGTCTAGTCQRVNGTYQCVNAGNVESPDIPGVTKSNIQSESAVLGVVKGVIRVVYTVFFILTVFFLLLAAYQYLFSGGDPDKVKQALKNIMYAAVAIAVALIATGFSAIITNFIEKGGGA